MSDLYDSLEDDCDRKNSLSDSLDGDIPNTGVYTPESKITPKTAFYLNPNGTEQESNLNFQNDRCAPRQKKNFLPKIETKGLNEPQNFVVDTEILQAQGLQLNNDGSFSKSPRPFLEQLPFITREYRNLQFQKKKTYKMVKKTSTSKVRNDIFSFSKSPDDGISTNKAIGARRAKRPSEEILTSAGSVSSRPREPKKLLPRDNLTDSMKEKLLLSQRSTPSGTSKIVGDLRKTRRVMNLLDIHKTVHKNRFSQFGGKTSKGISVGSSELFPGKKKGKVISLESDIPANAFKPTLSYAEQRQREHGFNPLRLRLENKKPLSDSDRSNFGDSVVDRLSEISSRIVSSKNLEDEDEELFYKKLMENDQKQTSAPRSSRSEGPYGITKLKGSAESISVKDHNTGRHNVRLKPISKSLSIDLQPQTDGATQALKKNHYCSADSSSKLSRCELALKAKTYGYLVNARNVFKMKAQSEAKMSPKKGDINDKSVRSSSNSEKPAENSEPVKDPSKSIFPKVEGKKWRGTNKSAETKKTPCKTGKRESPKVGVRGVVLPQVVGPDERDTKIQTEILNRMSMCLNSVNGEIEDRLIDV